MALKKISICSQGLAFERCHIKNPFWRGSELIVCLRDYKRMEVDILGNWYNEKVFEMNF